MKADEKRHLQRAQQKSQIVRELTARFQAELSRILMLIAFNLTNLRVNFT